MKLSVHQLNHDYFLLYVGLLFEWIWTCKNELVFHSRHPIVSNIALCLKSRWEEFSSSLNFVQAISCVAQIMASAYWCPPLVSIIKINVDITFCDDMCFLGMVTQNWCREVLKLLTKKDYIIVVEVAKAKTIVPALQLVKNSSWVRVVESNAFLVVKCIDLGQRFSSIHWECISYIQGCLTLRNSFNSCSIIWGSRKVNKTAHILCK